MLQCKLSMLANSQYALQMMPTVARSMRAHCFNARVVTHHVSFCSCVTAGKINAYGWLRYSGFARHKDPKLDAAGALADLLVFSLNLTGLDILQKIENQDNSW